MTPLPGPRSPGAIFGLDSVRNLVDRERMKRLPPPAPWFGRDGRGRRCVGGFSICARVARVTRQVGAWDLAGAAQATPEQGADTHP